MHRDRLNIEFIYTGQEPRALAWPLKDIDYVEQLIYSILEAKGVGPVYRQLFGIRLVRSPNIWLAPNIKTQDLIDSHLGTSPGQLELRMRFRPSSYTKLLVLDKKAFEIVFAQIRYDFLYTKFSTTDRKNSILLNQSILGLITNDLIRHALENDINDEEIFKRVKLEKFIPQNATRWQRALLYHLREKLNLPKSIQVGFRCCDRNVMKVKKAFIKLFLYDVCPDYGSETYRVICLDDPKNPIDMNIRVRYIQTSEDSSCIVEGCRATQNHHRSWFELCDIYSICYGSICGDTIEIDRICGRLLRVKFQSPLEARSFVSLLDGYYRLMRKWYFNFCRDVTSPDLEFLKRIKCHGPIGLESMLLKLNELKRPGSFIIRRCMEINNRFLIDAILRSKVRLMIDVHWDSESESFSMVGHFARDNRGMNVEIYLNHPDYKDLKTMIHELQIRIDDPDSTQHPPQQLKHWIPPSEHDDYPALLLSISKKKIKEFDRSGCMSLSSFTELPKIFPSDMIQPYGKILQGVPNRLSVRAANLHDERNVIIKEHIDDELHSTSLSKLSDLVLYLDSGARRNMEFFTKLKPAQLRLADWIFVKGRFVAETIGLDLTRNALIQEHLPFGTLDRYISTVCDLPKIAFRSIIYQLASTLLFLQENGIIHGKLRCHNFLIKSLNPLQIKLTDPLGTIDAHRDRAFMPPEYSDDELRSRLDANGLVRIGEFEPSFDTWAFGTVIWQVYNQGRRPALGAVASVFTKPLSCPDKIWKVINSCWSMDALNRASPQKIFRDLNDEFAWQIYKDDYQYLPSNKDTDSIESKRSPEHSIYSQQTSYDISFSDSITSPAASADGSQIDLISSRTTSISLASSDSPIPLLSDFNRSAPSRQSLMSWRNFFRTSAYCRSTYRKTGYHEVHGNGSLPFVRRNTSSSSIPSSSGGTKITVLSAGTSVNGLCQFLDVKIDPSQIKLISEIGRGNNGTVFKGVLTQWDSYNERVVAVKRLHKHKEEAIQINELKQEYEMLRNLDHENIVKTLGLVSDGDSKMLVMEFMPLGSLHTRLKNLNHDDLFTLPLHKYACDIAKGMEYLESMKITHRDLALRNILVKSRDEVKICDFGLARTLDCSNRYKLQTDRPLPIKWYAPEVLSTWIFTHKSDLWSYGIVLWEIYSGGNVPQYSGTYLELSGTLKHERLLIPKGCPMQMYAIMLRCWALNPNDRGNFKQIREKLESLERE